MELRTTPPLPVLAFSLASLKGSHQKVLKKMSRSCQKLIENFIWWPSLDVLDCNKFIYLFI